MRCNCENLACTHGDRPCPRQSDLRKRLMYVGAVCPLCFVKADPKYRLNPNQETK